MSADMQGNGGIPGGAGDTLFDELRAVVRDAEALVKATSAQTGERLQETRARAEESLRIARARLAEFEDDAMRRAREMADTTESYVRENPWQAVGVAVGVGVLIGLLMHRR